MVYDFITKKYFFDNISFIRYSFHNSFFAEKKMNLFLISFGALFSVINPLGTLPVFIGLTKDKEKKEIVSVALFTSINVLIILGIGFFAGKYLLPFFGISLNSLKIAGGIVIASSGFALLSGSFTKHKGMKKSKVREDIKSRSDITLTPLAIPMLAGPGTLSLLISYNQEYAGWENYLIILLSIIVVTVIVFLLLVSSRLIVKSLGASGINALSRIIGFIVISIGIEYILSTVISIVDGYVN